MQAASGALARFGDDLRTSAKSDGWSVRQTINAHRDSLSLALAAVGPVIEERLAAEVEADREAEANKAEAAHYSSASHARIGAAPQARPEAAALEGFKSEVRDAINTSPTSQVARERVAAIIATAQVKHILHGSGK